MAGSIFSKREFAFLTFPRFTCYGYMHDKVCESAWVMGSSGRFLGRNIQSSQCPKRRRGQSPENQHSHPCFLLRCPFLRGLAYISQDAHFLELQQDWADRRGSNYGSLSNGRSPGTGLEAHAPSPRPGGGRSSAPSPE